MKSTIIWILSESKKENSNTLKSLQENLNHCGGDHELLIYTPEGARIPDALTGYSDKNVSVIFRKDAPSDDIGIYQDAAQIARGDLVTMVYGGDRWDEKLLDKAVRAAGAGKTKNQRVFMARKSDLYNRPLVFSNTKKLWSKANYFKRIYSRFKTSLNKIQDMNEMYSLQPLFLGGTFVRREYFTPERFHKDYALETERAYFMDLLLEQSSFCFLGGVTYYSARGREGDVSTFPDIYKKEWYFESISGFWIPYLTKLKQAKGEIPLFVQCNCMFSFHCRLISNLNNQNKHILSEEEVGRFYALSRELLRLLDDRIVFNSDAVRPLKMGSKCYMLYAYIKYGLDFRFNTKTEDGIACLAVGDNIVDRLQVSAMKNTIMWMNWKNGFLHIDGVINVLLHNLADEIVIRYDGKEYPLVYDGSYALIKYFGLSAYKNMPFSVELPLDGPAHGQEITTIAKVGGSEYPISFSYKSHYSRMSDAAPSFHWCFGPAKRYMISRKKWKDNTVFKIRKANALTRFLWETRLLAEFFISFNPKSWQFIAVRLAYHIAKPFIKKNKKIWLYLDKIYKAGDSSEYLFRYAMKKKDPGIDHYYLVDKNTTDYKRLVNDGFTPLIRRTIRHRLIFLYADMMVMS
ncbi:MAG: hypothetical protein K6C41_05650, partial [Lachnospiraceae bacterium]|nr:hypothetical protein [Lachnospiraceae bacterium]